MRLKNAKIGWALTGVILLAGLAGGLAASAQSGSGAGPEAGVGVDQEANQIHSAQGPFNNVQDPVEPASIEIAQRQSSDPFSALVGRRAKMRASRAEPVMVERYVIATDDRVFLFENRGSEARLKFLCRDGDDRLDCRIDNERSAEEIHQLRATSGPRGDLIFKDLNGQTYLRLASYGGATVFWPGDKSGQAAAKSFGDQTSLRLPFADVTTARRRAQNATALVSAKAGAPIIFDLGRPAIDSATGAAVLADAVVRAAKGVFEVAQDDAGADALASQIDTVRLMAADVAELSLDGRTLEVRYNPNADLAGRPSSATVARFLEDSL
ncbi:MAG: DUF4908 domain-containing protein [Pseudomonadota bacterium]